MRRVVTGHKDGKSVTIDDAEISLAIPIIQADITPIWKTDSQTTVPIEESRLEAVLLEWR